ncbi:hypothetical protein BDP81DRAFT_310530 [Colletotrichum phormii]|uniref:6-phosphogluconate dehydrogenase NADP-binding domain-containing protein n=1 Tax=Colletotrichum phormii TaxID=359342 RepID=A0AAJ0EJA7_9PEZI|nr:uncharacterized protein BDP81DRAFT_310530 [Colletotrichum phormii]KAK1640839.1 hypothetical protein BDP81DRAFT_310530 [Colletotrichum phormii]
MLKTDTTIIGVGNLGAAMVKVWLKAGLAVTMWNRNPQRPSLNELVEKGAVLETDIRAATHNSGVIVLCVSTYDNIMELLLPALPLGEVGRSVSVINVTTGTPKEAREMESFLKKNGITAYLDGAIMVTPALMGTEHSSLFFSGEDDTEFQKMSRYLEPLGQAHYISEDSGAASLWDLAALAAWYGSFTGGIVALNLLKRQKPDRGNGEAPTTKKPMDKIILPLLSTFLSHLSEVAQALDDEAWEKNFGNPASMQIKGLETILRGVREEKVSTEGLELFHRMLNRCLEEVGDNAGLAKKGTYLQQ